MIQPTTNITIPVRHNIILGYLTGLVQFFGVWSRIRCDGLVAEVHSGETFVDTSILFSLLSDAVVGESADVE